MQFFAIQTMIPTIQAMKGVIQNNDDIITLVSRTEVVDDGSVIKCGRFSCEKRK